MINRTLIRLKTVQMLYSYLLTRHEFTIEPEPKKLTKNTRSAYALYLDLLLVILKLSGKQIGNCDNVFACSSRLEQFKLVNLISHNEKIVELINKDNANAEDFDSVLQYIDTKIINSVAYKDFIKLRKPEIEDEANFWTVILRTLFAKDALILKAAMKCDCFTQIGYQRAIDMVVSTLSSCSDSVTVVSEMFDRFNDCTFTLFRLSSISVDEYSSTLSGDSIILEITY